MMKKSRGFTLIELLVVIAIIAVLANVVISAVRIAREKGQVAQIQENFESIRTEANIYFDNNGGYGSAGTSCTNASSLFSDTTVLRLVGQATSTANQAADCANSATAFVVSVLMPNGDYICTDTSGALKNTQAATSTINCQ